MFSKSKLKDYIGILYYRHGLFCASHPISCLFVVFSVIVLCCYPLKNLQSFSSSLEQYKQSIDAFDGLEANPEHNEFVEYEKLADRPGWYNRAPIAYIQRIVVKSIINIPKSIFFDENQNETMLKFEKLNLTKEQKLFLIDTFRTPLSQLFELNDFIRNFQTEKTFDNKKQKSLIGDLCVHVGELGRDDKFLKNKNLNRNEFNKHFLPEFNCLYLSPANFWSNNIDEFKSDDDLMQTINDSPFYLKNLNLKQTEDDLNQLNLETEPSQEEKSWANLFINLFNRLLNKNDFLDEKTSTNLRELLFGVSWSSTLKSLRDDLKLFKRLNESNFRIENTKSIVMTYAITIALKNYDKPFLDELKQKLDTKFNFLKTNQNETVDQELEFDKNFIYNLQYTRQSFVYYIPYALLYFLLFLYIYISVRKIEFVKSKWGLAFAAVVQVIASLFMSIGICSFFGFTPTLNGGEVFPYLIIFIGFENIVVLTKSVVSTPFDLDVRYRIALGLKKESWVITKILTFELIIIFFGILTMVPAIQEFCIFAYVGLLIDFFMQMIYFVTVLSIDIRRMELSDLNKKLNSRDQNQNNENSNFLNQNFNYASNKNGQIIYRGNYSSQNSDLKHFNKTNIDNLNHHHRHHHNNNNSMKYSNKFLDSLRNFLFGKNYATFFMNKSVQFFYFWARTRIVQRAIMILSILWIILIFYKSLLVVELMRYDFNVNKETVEALLPKGVGFTKLLKDNFQQLLFTSTSSLMTAKVLSEKSRKEPVLPESPEKSSAIHGIKRNFQNFLIISTMNIKASQNDDNIHSGSSIKSSYTSFESKKPYLLDDQNWQSLSYYHWLTLFSYYNVSLYNRYVAILPQINLYRLVKQSDILKFRNQNEIKKYNSILTIDNESRFLIENTNESDTNQLEFDNKIENQLNGSSIKSALFELISIVILGIPTIFLIVYFLTMVYKFLCSKNYEEWRKSWSTSNIKRQYKIIHSKLNRNRKSKSLHNSDDDNYICCDRLKEDCSDCEFDANHHQRNYSSDYDSFDDHDQDLANDETCNYNLKKKISSSNLLKLSSNRDEVINKIINGQINDIVLAPFKTINSEDDLNNSSVKHKYPLDLISTGNNILATSDISNQIKIWSLRANEHEPENDLIKTISLNQEIEQNVSIWSMCLTDDDQYILIGQSDGKLKIVNLFANSIQVYREKVANGGVTHLIQLKSISKNVNSFYQQQNFISRSQLNLKSNQVISSNESNDFENYLVLLSRLNGYIEIFSFNTTNNKFIFNLKAHQTPITNLCYSNGSDYLITSGQDFLLKIIKINFAKLNQHQQEQHHASSIPKMEPIHQNNDKEMSIMFELNEHENNQITSICIEKDNIINAATGSENGLICLWNLFTGECKLKLRNKQTKENSNIKNTIIKLEISQNLVVSLNSDQQMCIWNRHTGNLIKEFKFFAPSLLTNNDKNIMENSDLNLNSTNSVNSTIFTFLKYYLFSRNKYEHLNLINQDLFQSTTTMCLYSKNILITGGFSCLFLWDILKGELIKKINIKKNSLLINQNMTNKKMNKNIENFSQINIIKDIKLIRQSDSNSSKLFTNNKINRTNKLIIATDYNDSIYILKIPLYIVQNYD